MLCTNGGSKRGTSGNRQMGAQVSPYLSVGQPPQEKPRLANTTVMTIDLD